MGAQLSFPFGLAFGEGWAFDWPDISSACAAAVPVGSPKAYDRHNVKELAIICTLRGSCSIVL